MNTLLLVLLLLIIDANVAASSGQIRLRGSRIKSDKKLFSEDKKLHSEDKKLHSEDRDSDDRTAAAAKEESSCQDIDLDLIGTRWNLTEFAWNSSQEEGGEEILHPVDLTRERRGMILQIEEDGGTSGSCGNNYCWGVREKIGEKMFWIHGLARTRMMSTPQEEAYAKMLTRSPYSYKTCVDSSTEHTQLHLFEVDIDKDENLVQGRLMAVYVQI